MFEITSVAKPATVDEALTYLTRGGATMAKTGAAQPGVRLLAGGTDLLVASRDRNLRWETLIDLKNIPELHGIHLSGGTLRVGSTTTIHELAASPLVAATLPPLAEAAGMLGSYQLRQRATLGGNICNASPATETACPLLVGNARVQLAGPTGTRTVPLCELLLAPGKTALESGEILVSVECAVPERAHPDLRYGGAYIKLGPRRAMDIAIVNVAVLVGLDTDSVCRDARIALGSVGPTAFRVPQAEDLLIGQALGSNAVAAAADAARAAARPITDIRATAGYRLDMVRNLVETAIITALERVTPAGL